MKAELLNILGDDLMIVNAARVSYGKKKNSFDESDKKLINFLLKHKHVSPFKHPQIQYRVNCPIFVERQLFKHQIGLTANSISGRYVDFSESCWFPDELRYQSSDSKQGSGDSFDDPELLQEIKDHIEKSQILYQKLNDKNVAKELSRIILPLSLNTIFIWTGSLWAFIHLFNLRLKSDAQKETRILVSQMLDLLLQDGSFNNTLEILLSNDYLKLNGYESTFVEKFILPKRKIKLSENV
jgi:thymidylate synthase (FAD)